MLFVKEFGFEQEDCDALLSCVLQCNDLDHLFGVDSFCPAMVGD
jgi:hypothetical protein